jgi:hypothetical protein
MTVVPSVTKNSSYSQIKYANGVTLKNPGSATHCVAPPWEREIDFQSWTPTGFHNGTNLHAKNRFPMTVFVRPLQGRTVFWKLSTQGGAALTLGY